ncbi:MAG: hypothetical protein IKS05_04470, partial [Oscillospiraceae bacterium]|nr:hypothetical protein [Oscillospiraceae bacterium]
SCERIPRALQGKILLLKLREILGCKTARGTLQRIIAEAPAAAFGGNEAFFCAEHEAVSRLAGADAESAAFFYVFPKQHNKPPVLLFSVL